MNASEYGLWKSAKQVQYKYEALRYGEGLIAPSSSVIKVYKPFRGYFPLTQAYRPGHPALDFGMPNGTSLFSVAAGRVVDVAVPGYGYGRYVHIVHDEIGLSSLYAHMQRYTVRVGQRVAAGEMIGTSNDIGYSTGPHLHFELRRPPYAYSNAIDPWGYLGADPPGNPPPPVPPPSGSTGTVVKATLSIYVSPNSSSRVVGHYTMGQRISFERILPVDRRGFVWGQIANMRYVIIRTINKLYVRL